MSNSCASASTKYKTAKSRVIRLKAKASLYNIDSKALYAKALKPNLQAFVYK
jgi:hypothetical protein